MSVTVRHLNGDSTFLLIFSPVPDPKPSDLRSINGAYSVLIDPWIVGSSVTTAPWFAITNRVQPSSIQHLSELGDEPDVVICSQNKTDHTNKETLLQLRPESQTLIVAEPGAAKTIKSWNHFDPRRVHTMAKYDAKSKNDNILRLSIAPLSEEGDTGLITITFVPAKNYVTGLHNAFGITYQPPTKVKSLSPVSTIDLSTAKMLHRSTTNLSSPYTPLYSIPHDDTLPGHAVATDQRKRPEEFPEMKLLGIRGAESPHRMPMITTPPEEFGGYNHLNEVASDFSFFGFGDHVEPKPFSVGLDIPTPPMSPRLTTSTRSSSFSTLSSSRGSAMNSLTKASSSVKSSTKPDNFVMPANKSKTISIIYSPHGLPLEDLQSYIRNHLVSLPGALPLTLLLHSFDHTANPWYLGGNITTGAEGGMQIAKALMAKCWISAHDAEKDKHGIAVKLLKLRKNDVDQVKQQFDKTDEEKIQKWICDVRSLQVGEEVILAHITKQSVGIEINNCDRAISSRTNLSIASTAVS